MSRSLIIAPQWIGDAVTSEPLLRLLAQRGERLSVFAVPWVAPIYRAMRHIKELEHVIEVPLQHGRLQRYERQALAARLREGEWGAFDQSYVLPNSLKSALVPFWAEIPKRVGYTGEMRLFLLTHRIPNPSARKAREPMVDFYLKLAQFGHLTADDFTFEQKVPRLHLTSHALPHNLTPHRYTVIAPGAEYGPAKRWPAHHFAQLIAQLQQTVVLIGSEKEHALCQDIQTQALEASPHNTIINLAGQTTLDEAIEIVAHTYSMVSNDSGMMHVAAAFGIAQVAIFGSSDPRHTPPLNDHAQVLWLKRMRGLDCAPCFQRECPHSGQEHLQCLNNIDPGEVMEALSKAASR